MKTKKIAVIDPYLLTPCLSGFNHLVDLLENARLQYHLPQVMGFESLVKHPADAFIVMGSASHVTQPLPWHAPLSEFLMARLREHKPVLGICFGHQLLCQGFGADIGFIHESEEKLTGVRAVEMTTDAYGLSAGQKLVLTVSHRQVVKTLPTELRELGRGLAHDFVSHVTLPFLGVQPHPEALPGFTDETSTVMSEEATRLARQDGDLLISAFFRAHHII